LPEAVIWPESQQEVSEVLKYANKHGNSLEWMKRIKQLFDPNGILNPGKIFPD
jgi:D-lactate dehydrogenase (cytochrome)